MIGKKPQLAARLSREIAAWLMKDHPTWQPKFPLDKKTGKSVGPPPVL